MPSFTSATPVRSAIVGGLLVFSVIFLGLRLAEHLYHTIRHTPDWSPHWGTWVFALLAGLYITVTNLGR